MCEWCGGYGQVIERHHRKRRRDGGDRLCNVIYLCRPHHQWVTEHPAEARKLGLIVSVYRDPADVPILYHRKDWMLLDDDGGKMLWPAPELDDAHA